MTTGPGQKAAQRRSSASRLSLKVTAGTRCSWTCRDAVAGAEAASAAAAAAAAPRDDADSDLEEDTDDGGGRRAKVLGLVNPTSSLAWAGPGR